jgi:hypothetical protein
MPLTDRENQQLAELITHVRKTWKDCNNPDSRRDYENRVIRINADLMNDAIDRDWHRRYDALANAYAAAVKREAGAAQHTVQRVSVLAYNARCASRKTVRTDDLTLALRKCETCGLNDAVKMWHQSPLCEGCYTELEKVQGYDHSRRRVLSR